MSILFRSVDQIFTGQLGIFSSSANTIVLVQSFAEVRRLKRRALLLATSVVIIAVVLGVGMNLDRILGRSVLTGQAAAIPFSREEAAPTMAQGIDAFVATNQKELDDASRITASQAPVVDFDKAVVVAICTNKSSQAKSIKIDRIDQKGNEVQVKVTMVAPLANQKAVGSDMVTVEKKNLKQTGVLTFTFVDQNGKELARKQALVK